MMKEEETMAETLSELCAKYKLEPKNVRSKLRRAVAEKKMKHSHRSSWEVTPSVRAFVVALSKKLPAKAMPKKAAKKAVKKAAAKKAATPKVPKPSESAT